MTQSLSQLDIDQVTTLPTMEAIDTAPSTRSIKLPGPEQKPQVYIPVTINIENPKGLALALVIFLSLAACTAVNIGMLFLHQIIIVR